MATVIIGAPDGEPYEILIDDTIFTVGRRADCDLPVPDKAVSALHARFELELSTGSVRVTDLGSKNGTRIDGRRIEPNRPVEVATGGVVRISNINIEIRFSEERSQSMSFTMGQTGSLSRSLLGGVLGEEARANRAVLEGMKGPGKGQSTAIDERVETTLIGVGPDVDIDLGLTRLEHNPVIIESDLHGYLLIPNEKARIRLAGDPVLEPRRLRDGDELRILKSTLRFKDPLQAAIDDLDGATDDSPPMSLPEPSVPREVGDSKSSQPWTRGELALIGFALVAMTVTVLVALVVLGLIRVQ